MADDTITCPHCQKEIPLSEAFAHKLDKKMEAALADAKAEATATAEDELKARLAKAEQKTGEKYELKLKNAKAEAEENEAELKKFRNEELALRKKNRDLEKRQEDMKVEQARQLDAERKKIEAEAKKTADEDHRLKEAEKDKQIASQNKLISELKRKSEVGSQQLQGEVLELDLEEKLRQEFPMDEIRPVEKGIKGADILQTVKNKQLEPCGTIIWELKRTKAWKDDWLTKLKEDQRTAGAEIAVLVTEVLPKSIEKAGWKDKVWITDHTTALSSAASLRYGLNLAHAKQIQSELSGKDQKMEAVYDYITSTAFQHKIEAILEAFEGLRTGLDQEKKAFAKIWKKREQQIEQVMNSTAGLHGDLSGIAGKSLPEVKSLSLEAGTEESEVEN